MNKRLVLIPLLIISAVAIGIFLKQSKGEIEKSPGKTVTPTFTPAPVIAFPVNEFKQRITKKPFGVYVTDGFTGYHTGADVEYADVTAEVPVFAIADGVVVTSTYASGYGGVMVVKNEINSRTLYVIYGHLRQNSMLGVNKKVTKGEKIAVLGTGYSQETDGERRHLHFGVALSNTITGYVSTKSDLAGWINPLALY